MRRSSLKKIAMMLTLSMLVGSGCSKDQSAETTLGASEVIPEATTTVQEYDQVITAACDLFPEEALEYYIPFGDPNNSFCYYNEGCSARVYNQFRGSCWLYSSVSCMTIQQQIDVGGTFDPPVQDIMAIVRPSDDQANVEGYHHEYGMGNVRWSIGGCMPDVTEAMSITPYNGYYVVESELYVDDMKTDTSSVDTEGIKELIRDQGPLCIGVGDPLDYLTANNGYITMIYPSDAPCVHQVVIVGYDDNFPADCFSYEASSDGAWLCQDSQGDDNGNSGYFWLSYDSVLFDPESVRLSNEYSDVITYCNCPASYRYGDWIANEGEEMAFASCYDHAGTVGAIGVYTPTSDSTLKLEILDGEFGDELASYEVSYEYPGYHTIELDTPLEVTEFTVIIRTDDEYVFEMYYPEDAPYYPYVEDEYLSHFQVFTTAYYVSYPEEGHSFIEINGEWVDLTDRETLAAVEEYSQLSDPAINILYV